MAASELLHAVCSEELNERFGPVHPKVFNRSDLWGRERYGRFDYSG